MHTATISAPPPELGINLIRGTATGSAKRASRTAPAQPATTLAPPPAPYINPWPYGLAPPAPWGYPGFPSSASSQPDAAPVRKHPSPILDIAYPEISTWLSELDSGPRASKKIKYSTFASLFDENEIFTIDEIARHEDGIGLRKILPDLKIGTADRLTEWAVVDCTAVTKRHRGESN